MEKPSSSFRGIDIACHPNQPKVTTRERLEEPLNAPGISPPGQGEEAEGSSGVYDRLLIPQVDPIDETEASSNRDSLLEGLPVEIQELILFELQLQALSSVVHASPRLYAAYAQNRPAILRASLALTLPGLAVDAHYCHVSATYDFQQSWKSFSEYQLTQLTTPSAFDLELPFEDVTAMARFHASTIEPLAERYAEWALGALRPSHGGTTSSMSPSSSELLRIYRGLYHLQIFCNLCGHEHRPDSTLSDSLIAEPDDHLIMLSHYPAWQVEEILCVHDFVKDQYDRIFDHIGWDFDEKNPMRAGTSPWSPEEPLNLDPETNRCYGGIRNTVLLQGLPLLSTVLDTRDHSKLVDLMREPVSDGKRLVGNQTKDWLSYIVEPRRQQARREEWALVWDSAQDAREDILFKPDDIDWPPMAWVMLWKGLCSNLFGGYVPDALRRWGYVMWDARRLDSGAKQYILAEWKALYGDGDPRDPDYPYY